MFLMRKNYILLNKAKTYGFIWNFDKKICHRIELTHVAPNLILLQTYIWFPYKSSHCNFRCDISTHVS